MPQVGFVDDGDGVGRIQTQIHDLPILVGEFLRAVAYKNGKIGLLQCPPGTFHAQGLHGVVGFPDACGVDEPEPGGAHHHRFLHGIPGGAGDVGDNGPVKACQGIQQAGFSHIGLAHNGGSHTLTEDSALTVGFQQVIQRFGVTS